MNASSSLFRLEGLVCGGALSGTAAIIAQAVDLPMVAVAGAGAAALLSALSWVQVRLIGREIGRGRHVLQQLQRGNFDVRLTGVTDRGPLGGLLKDINDFADRTDAFVREAKASLSAVSQQKYYRRIIERGMLGSFCEAAHTVNMASQAMAGKVQGFQSVTDEFEHALAGIVGTVASASTQLRATAGSMSGTAHDTSEEATAVAAAADQATANVQTVASAAEELSASIAEISSQVSRSSAIARAAAVRTTQTHKDVGKLTDAAKRIGEVVGLIQAVASQTNLLALNATIEAARAGEAGKGFAVVAGEVKNLAGQTAKATEDIGEQVAAIQGAANGAVVAIQDIGHVVEEVNGAMSAIAAAIEQQAAATREIARNVEQACAGTGEVCSRINHVRVSAGETGAASSQVLHAAGDLSQQSEALGDQLKGFLSELRRVV